MMSTYGGGANAHVLTQTIRAVSAEKIDLRTEDSNLLIESRGTKTLIKAVPHNEFPTLSSKDVSGIAVSRDLLLRGIQSVSYAASPSMIRPELGSVYVSMTASGIVTAATDSFRLAEKTILGTAKHDQELLIPLKHALELTYVLESIESETVEIHLNDSEITISGDDALVGHVRYISRVVDGQFPNYQEIIPKKFTTEATVLKNDFAEMLRKARVFSGNDQHVGLHLYPKRKIFTATAQLSDVGEMSDSIDAALWARSRHQFSYRLFERLFQLDRVRFDHPRLLRSRPRRRHPRRLRREFHVPRDAIE